MPRNKTLNCIVNGIKPAEKMDSISVLLTSCIVIVLLALTTFKYAFIKLKKQSFEKDDNETNSEPLFNGDIQNETKANGLEFARSVSNSPIKTSKTEIFSMEQKTRTPTPEVLLNGYCTKNIADDFYNMKSFDQVDFGEDTNATNSVSPVSTNKDSEATEIVSVSNEGEHDAHEVIEKISQHGNVKTTRIVYTNPTVAELLSENFIKEIEKNVIPNADKSTLIIHAVQKPQEVPPVEDCKVDDNCDFDEFPLPSLPENEQYHFEFLNNKPPRKRRGSIFRSLRHRLSRKHSYSLKNPNVWETEQDKKDILSEKDDIILRCSVPVPLNPEDHHSATSSVSELSTMSKLSTATYTHENSTLVIECNENQVRKFYLVPSHLMESGKWKKKGKKLHIYNKHSFIAKHISSGTCCEICGVRISFALGKQGYQCRDCKLICHKECHVKTPHPCPNTSIYDYEL